MKQQQRMHIFTYFSIAIKHLNRIFYLKYLHSAFSTVPSPYPGKLRAAGS